jgi:hypothetical protein
MQPSVAWGVFVRAYETPDEPQAPCRGASPGFAVRAVATTTSQRCVAPRADRRTG